MSGVDPKKVLEELRSAQSGEERKKLPALNKAASQLKDSGLPLSAEAKEIVDAFANTRGMTIQMDAVYDGISDLIAELEKMVPEEDPGAVEGGRRRRRGRGKKTRKHPRKGRRKTRKLRGRGFFRFKKLDAGLAGGVVPAGEIVSVVQGSAGKRVGEINVSSVFSYDRGLKLLEAITATNTSKYKKGYTLVQELSRNSGKVTLGDGIGEMYTSGMFDPDDVQQAVSELRMALSNYKPETGEVV